MPKAAAAIRQQHGLGAGPVLLLIGSGIENAKVRFMVEGLLARNLAGTLIVVAGRNYTLQQSLAGLRSSERLPDCRVLGFVDYLDDLVAASDLVITKSGGLITSEVMARGTPLLVTEPIHDKRSLTRITWSRQVLACASLIPCLTSAESLIAEPPHLARMRQNAAVHGRPQAALDVADIVLNAIN